ncbi:MAG: ABC transporter permease [Spirochaetaceae bacterium]|nr:ABC transporter permease [Spirochaetaceae bacterium]MBQ4555923.1 ABC transporter permease [Spirochaetaceae bacterium]
MRAINRSFILAKENTSIKSQDNEKWDLVLQPKSKLLDLKIRELIRYRDLVLLFIKRDFTTAYKQTILGPLWYIVQPLVSTVMYTFIFGNLAEIGTDGVPYLLFYFAGTMLWTYFTGTLNSASSVFTSNSGLFGKIYFPRLTVPISTTVGHIIKLGIQFACLLVFYIYYLIVGANVNPSWWILAFPLLIIWIGLLGCGIGMVISALTTKYRDLNQLLSFGLSLAMYATPIVYPLSEAPANLAWVFYINPMSAPVELFRIWFYGAGSVPTPMIFLSLGMTAVFFFFGLVLFNRNERTFVDVV